MKFAECECEVCKSLFKVTFIKDILSCRLNCPVCGSTRLKYMKVDGDE